ncbi:hypothetical protein A4U53_035160 (plasmid) [Rhizobium ruizarguesonis]|uniref:Uncharacterized protein n=1 Tax=Rhizobium ruizarguesonis TaxID=2081791 RepID=A0ACD5EVC9_9HYPH|nr:hypothetical protein [Rhizobium leguminosarum]
MGLRKVEIETVASDIEAGEDEDKMREVLSAGDEQGVKMPKQEQPMRTIGALPSSSF